MDRTRLRLAQTNSRLLLALAVCFASAIAPLRAQEAANTSGAAFDSLSFALRTALNVNRNTFHDFWDPEPGLEIESSTPFYLGRVEAGLQYLRFSARSQEQPDFSVWLPYLGWGLGWTATGRLTWHNSARVGMSFMRFAEIESNPSEQELAIDLSSRLSFSIAGPWAVDVGGRYQVVFTEERLRWLFLTVGLRHNLATPGWLKEFLR